MTAPTLTTGPVVPTCHACDQPATHQTARPATPDEAEQHWTALEQNIRASNSGNPNADYVADRTDTVVKAVHHCDDPDHADPAYLAAKQAATAAADAYTAAMNDLVTTAGRFTPEQIRQLTDAIRQLDAPAHGDDTNG